MNLLLAFALLLPALLPSAAGAAPVAQAADTEQDPPVQQDPPLDPPFVVDPIPATVDPTALTPGETPVGKPENLFVIVGLETTSNILTPDSTVAVTVTVRAEADLPTDKADLTLTLPKGVATTAGDKNKVQWPLPLLKANETLVQSLSLQIDQVNGALKREVGTLVATVTAPSYPSIETTTVLAFAPTPPTGEDMQDATGAVIASSDGDVVLLAQPGVAPDGVVFRYSELYNWETVTATIVTPASVTITPDAPLTDTLSLTALTMVTPTDSLPTDTPSTDAPTPETARTETRPTAKNDHNLDAYRLWQLDALQDGQNLHQLTGEVLVQVSVKKLVNAGIDPTSLALWTREGAEGRWTPVPTVYNDKQQRLQAWLPHFSQFGLGAGLQQSGDMLPSVKAFTVDQLNGGAGVNIGLETPKGLGGLSPNLSLSYSSITMDDLFREAGANEIEAQAGSAGIGWHLGGVSYIARTDTLYDNGVPDTDKKFALVLNGTRVSISFQDGLWRTNPEIFAKIIWPGANSYTGNAQYQAHDYSPWTVWTGDGTKYEFGDAGTFPNAFSSVSPTGTALERTYGNQSFRVTKRWYLRKVTDTLGNTMEYNYQGEQGWETGCVDAGWVSAGQHWYTRAIDPNAIYWSGQGSGYTLRALLSYTSRTDTYILGDATNDCKQPLYGSNNRLTAVTVQVLSGGSWQTLRSYSLGQGTWGFGGNKNRLYLNNLDQLGKNGNLLQRYNFTYDFYNPNHVLLNAASTNFGGSVTYGYGLVRTSCNLSTCPHSMNRYAVTQQIAYDGLGNYRAVHHYYGPGTPGDEWSAVGSDGGFMGYKEVQSKYYTANSLSTELRRERLLSYSSGAVADRDNPDPRRGKLLRREMWTQSTGGTLLQATDYDWKAYWLENGSWQTDPTAASSRVINGQTVYPITWIKLEKETTTTGSAVDEKRYTYEGTYGNQTAVAELANGSPQRTTYTEYYPNTSAWITNKPAVARVYDSGSNCRAETRTVYDGNGGWYNAAPSQGLVRRIQRALIGCNTYGFVSDTDNNWQVSYFEYDAYGNQTRATDFGNSSSGDVTIYTSYDTAYRLFPIEQWYAASTLHKETATYYGVNGLSATDSKAFWGAMQEHCGVNDICTRQSYDEFGRRLRRWEAVAKGSSWGSDASANLLWLYYTRGFSGSNTNLIVEWRAPRCYGNFVRKHYNGLGELVQEQRPQQGWSSNTDGCNPGNNYPEVDVNYAYDALGRVVQQSVPVATTASWVNRPAVWSNGYTATSYDAIDRVTWVTAPNGEQQQYGYLGRALSITALGRNGDPNKIVKWQELDGLGNLKYVRTYNPNGSGWVQDAQVTLTHDVVGNLTSVVHPNSIGTTSLGYDLGGRKTSMGDPDLGSWSYAYDRQGKLTRQTDARNATICLYYDGMARLIGKHFRSDQSCPGSTGYNVIYRYDDNHSSSNRSRGQLTYVYTGVYEKTLWYNSQGLLSSDRIWVTGGSFYQNYYGYDAHLRPTTVTYPDSEVVTTNYNAMGLPSRLRSSWYGDLVDGTTAGGGITNGVNYDEAGRLRNMRFPLGNSLWRTQDYWPWTGNANNTNGRLKEIRLGTSSGASDRLYLLYGYDSFGNIGGLTEQYNAGAASTYSFCYDAQNRLVRGYAPYDSTKNCTTYTTGRAYSYDSAGRLTNYEGTGMTVVRGHSTFPTGAGYSFDNNGNYTALGTSQTLSWDHENRLASISGGYNESYLYDPDGQRVKKSSGDRAAFTVGPHYEVQRASCSGQTPPGNTNWQAYGGAGIYLDVNTSSCGFTQTPVYVTALGGNSNHFATTGADAIYAPTATGFRVYVRYSSGSALTPADANANGWHLNWSATPKDLQTPSVCSGQTVAGSTAWQAYGSTEIYLDVNTSACNFTQAPLYLTSLGGNGGQWATTGANAIYFPTASGFRVYVRYADGSAITPATANANGWQLNWLAVTNAAKNSTLCSGQTPPGATNWQAYGTGLYLDVNTSNCGLGVVPRYFTSLGGNSSHYATTGANAIYFPTASGFRVYVRFANDSAITPATANSWGWHMNWLALPTAASVVETKYYSFNGQRVAMRINGALTYLHSDHLGGTALATNSSGSVITEQGYWAYGRNRRGGALPTDHKFTGQKLDGSGLYYYNARYYNPDSGQFLSPDTLVPDPGNLFDYNRYMYVRGNPMNAIDPSGHICVPVVNIGNTCQGSTDWDAVQSSLDATGIVDPTPISDGVNAVISVARGNYVDAGLSAVAIVPYIGDLAKGGKYLDEAAAGARWVGDKADEGWQAAKRWTDCLINSFSAKTLVMTPAGLKAISELVEGDLVLAYNETTGEIGSYPITDVISHVDPEIVLLTIDGETLETTAEHPFYELESAPWLAAGQTVGRWTDALDLQAGDRVWKADGASGVVQSVEVAPVPQRMYNLTVAEAHTFFVGDGQWLVHNGGPCVRLTISEKQFGKKVADHAPDYGLDPRNPADRDWLRNHIQDIGQNFEEARQGAWHPTVKGGGTDFWFFRKGSDVVVAKGDGSFVTILKNGDTNSWFKKATGVTQN